MVVDSKHAFIKKIIYSIRANFLELIVNVIVTLLVPRLLGQDFVQFGFFQVYLFYIAYIGFFHFGWCDGILLREGGKNYEQLDKPKCSSQFLLISALEFVVFLLVTFFAVFFTTGSYRFVYILVGVNAVLYTPRRMLQYYLQSTNRIKEYARITEVGRGLYGTILLLIVFLRIKDYRIIIVGDVFGKLIALIVAIYICRDIVLVKPIGFKAGFSEALKNVSVGIKLLFANIASMLITGIVRWGIQVCWDISTYGKISFSLSVSNFLLSFLSAIAVVLYPTLKRIDPKKLPEYYKVIRNALMIFLFFCLIFYYPIQMILSFWLPQYSESIRYMAILFPVCVYAAKMTMLVQTYMNIFRLEKKVMMINLLGVGLALVTTLLSVFWFRNLTLAMLTIVINQMFRCVLAEIEVSRHIKTSVIVSVIAETFVVILFICFHWFIGGVIGMFLYISVFVVYIIFNKNDLFSAISVFKTKS